MRKTNLCWKHQPQNKNKNHFSFSIRNVFFYLKTIFSTSAMVSEQTDLCSGLLAFGEGKRNLIFFWNLIVKGQFMWNSDTRPKKDTLWEAVKPLHHEYQWSKTSKCKLRKNRCHSNCVGTEVFSIMFAQQDYLKLRQK